MAQAVSLASSAVEPTLIYVYVPHLDTVMHRHGAESTEALTLSMEIDRSLEQMSEAMPANVRMIVTADHGQTDAAAGRVFVLAANDPISQLLVAQPSGEPAVPIFHVQAGAEELFRTTFHERLGEAFVLLSRAEAESLQLLGPGALCREMRERMGTFIALALRPAKLYISPLTGCHPDHVGLHGGLTPAEVRIPVVAA